MADTKPLAILKAIETALGVASVTTNAATSITKPTGLTVTRLHLRPKEGALVAVVKAAAMETATVEMDLESAGFGRIACAFYAEVVVLTAGDPPEQYVDEAVRWVQAAVMDDTTLGGACKLIHPVGVFYDGMRGNDNEGQAAVRFRAIYHTAIDDPALGF